MAALAITPNPHASGSFQTTLRGQLDSPEFLPNGGILGFGLAHLYPVTFKTVLEDLIPYLKGEDAHVCRVCRELQLKPALQMIYGDRAEFGVMIDEIIERPNCDYSYGVGYTSHLVDELGGISVNKANPSSNKMVKWFDEGDEGRITRISPFSQQNRLKDITMAYGNEVSVGYIHCSPCLIAHVPPASDRT